MALEAEVARLDDARMDGADGHLMDLVPFDPIEIHDADDRDLARLATPCIVTGPIGSMEPHRLEPRVAFRIDAVLLSDLPLKEMDRRASGRQRGKSIALHRRFAALQ